MQYKRLRASQVRLDPQNPRLPEGTSSDRDAINRLLDEGFQALLALAKDLVEAGESNPSELPIVMKDGTKYLVLEGNRRFAALKLLANPSLADDPARRQAFKRTAAKGSSPETIMTAVASSREHAEHWLVLRHTGANKGVGVKTWSAEQAATHRRRANASIDSGTARSITIADELEETYAQDADLVARIRRVRTNKLTNIGRFFAADVMSRLHLSVRDTSDMYVRQQTLWTKHSADDLHDFLAWAMSFIDANPVDAYKNANIRRQLIDKHGALLPEAHHIESTEAVRLADLPYRGGVDSGFRKEDLDENGGNVGDRGKQEGTRSPDDAHTGPNEGGADDHPVPTGEGQPQRKHEARPERRLFQDLKLPHLSPRTQFLLKEARYIHHDESPGVACVMARVLVELAVSDPNVLAWSGAKEKDDLADKILACLRVLDPKIEKGRPTMPSLTQAYLETHRGFGIRYLHQFVHNPQSNPDRHLARRFSATWRPVLRAINDRTGQESA